MAVPLWMQIVAQGRVQPQGPRSRTPRTAIAGTPLAARGAGRPSGRGGRTKKEYPEGPQGVIDRLRDQGFSRDQINEVVGSKGGGGFDVLSPGDYLQAGGDLLTRALDVLDVPRAAVQSAAIEISDLVRPLPDELKAVIGPTASLGDVEDTDRVQQSGVSLQDFIANTFQNRPGFADVMEASEARDSMGPVAQAGLGLAIDIASDPLNYLGVGLADEPAKIARLFRNDDVIRKLGGGDLEVGRKLADEAAAKVLRKGTTSLSPNELDAIGRKGGLYTKVPGTGIVGRTLRLDKALAKMTGGQVPRTATLSARGNRAGDIASAVAQGTRKLSGLNLASRTIGKGAAVEGLAGNLGKLRGTIRGAVEDFDVQPLDALITINKEAEARGLSKAFELQMNRALGQLLRKGRKAKVEGRNLWHALGGDEVAIQAVEQKAPGLVDEFRRFFDEAGGVANERAGREFVRMMDDYTPRFLTPEAREAFRQGGKGGVHQLVKSLTGRQWVSGERLFGEELLDPAVSGRSIEAQIEGIVKRAFADREADPVKWFVDDAYEAFPQYVKTLSHKLSDEYLGNELVRHGVGKEALAATGDYRETGESVQRRTRLFQQRRQAKELVDDMSTALAKPAPWDKVSESWANADKIQLEKEFAYAINDGFRLFSSNAQLPEDIVGVLRDVGKMGQPGALQTVMDFHDRWMKRWKKLALFTPGYHMRNSFGGMWMNWVADVDEGRYGQLERLIANDPTAEPFFGRRRYHKLPKVSRVLPKIDDPQLVEAYEAAKRLGVFTGGQSIKEIEFLGDPEKLSAFQASRQMGSAVENRLRGAMFIDEYVKSGGDASAAFAKTQKYHFDYEALGRNEEKIRRFGIPFYTYTRRAIPILAELTIRNPSKVNRYFQIKRSVERLSEEEDLVPEYFTRNLAIRLPWKSGENQTYLMPDLPLMSLIDASDPNQALGQISPFIKAPLERGFGKQMWKGIPLDKDPVPLPSYLEWMKPALQATGKLRTDAEGNMVLEERDMYFATQLLPQLGQARRLLPFEERYQERQLTSMLSFIFGIGARTNTPREQANELWRRYDPYADAIEQNQELGFERDDARALAFG